MGAWGAAIFSDDLAADVRDALTDSIAEGLTVSEATGRLITDFRDALQDRDESGVFWLALAATCSKLGRLTEDLRDQAIEIIDSGRDLRRWEESRPADIARRRRHLEKLRRQLVGPQPPSKKLRPRRKSSTNFMTGDVATYRFNDSVSIRFCVLKIWGDRGGTYADICLLGLDDGAPYHKDTLTPGETLGPHFTMVSLEPADRITMLRRGVILPELTIELMRAWQSLPVDGWACTWDRFPDALQSVLPKTGWLESS